MARMWVGLSLSVVLFLFVVESDPAFAAGEKVLPQVVDGVAGDGTRFRTRFDITNLGPEDSTRISRTKIMFFLRTGDPWAVATNLGTASEFPLDLGALNTLRIETQGSGPLTAGYVLVRSSEMTTVYAEDYEVNVSAYYEVSRSGSVIDTISVPVAQPTIGWVNPVQSDTDNNLVTGFAIVNLSGAANTVTLIAFPGVTPSSGRAEEAGRVTFTLAPREQRARFLSEPGLLPGLTKFRGMIVGKSEQPVAVLALLQTPTATGFQYAMLSPTYGDSLRRNASLYLRQGYPLDADIPVIDYWAVPEDELSWDLLYETQSRTARRLAPRGHAAVAVLGARAETQFDLDVTIDVLRGLNYTTDAVDLSNGSTNLSRDFTFAVRTGLGRYVKIRIAEVWARDDERDLALDVYVYK